MHILHLYISLIHHASRYVILKCMYANRSISYCARSYIRQCFELFMFLCKCLSGRQSHNILLYLLCDLVLCNKAHYFILQKKKEKTKKKWQNVTNTTMS